MENRKKEKKQFDLFLISRYRNEIYGAAALWIALYHAISCGCIWPFPFRTLNLGIAGVETFLFLSGISLYFSYAKEQSVVRFYKKRLSRIYIAALIVLPYCMIKNYAFLSSPGRYIGRVFIQFSGLGYWMGEHNNFWYFPMIITCYLIYPVWNRIIFSKEKTSDQLIRTGILCLIEIICGMVVKRFFPENYNITKLSWTRFPIFTIGCLAGRFVYDRDRIKTGSAFFSIPAAVLSFALLLKYYPSPGYNAPRIVLYDILAVSLPVMLAGLFFLTEGTSWSFLNRFFRFLGNMSFEIFLWNILVAMMYKHSFLIPYQDGSLFRYLIVMTGGLFAAYVWYLIHRRLALSADRRF